MNGRELVRCARLPSALSRLIPTRRLGFHARGLQARRDLGQGCHTDAFGHPAFCRAARAVYLRGVHRYSRIEFQNPGTLYNTLTIENLYARCQPVRRDQLLTGFMRYYKSLVRGSSFLKRGARDF